VSRRSNAAPVKRDRARVLAAYRDHFGNVSQIARVLGVARQTVYDWSAADEELGAALREAREAQVDAAEAVLMRIMLKGKDKEALRAAIYTLSTRGKGRGWVTRVELTREDGDAPDATIIIGGEPDP
jgi:transposase-like protein